MHLKRGVSMELHLDASIDKLDNLAINVQLEGKVYGEGAETDRAGEGRS